MRYAGASIKYPVKAVTTHGVAQSTPSKLGAGHGQGMGAYCVVPHRGTIETARRQAPAAGEDRGGRKGSEQATTKRPNVVHAAHTPWHTHVLAMAVLGTELEARCKIYGA